MDTLRAVWGIFQEWFSGVRRRIANKKLDIEFRRQRAEATNRQREEKKAEQQHCGAGWPGHNYVRVRSESGNCFVDFEICQRCQKIHDGFGVENRVPVWELESYLNAVEAYPPADRPEAELYEMPLDQLQALAEATK